MGLAIGMRVWNGEPGAVAWFGEVVAHRPRYSRGEFPVRFDDQPWEVLDVSYGTPIAAAEEAVTRDGRVASSRRASLRHRRARVVSDPVSAPGWAVHVLPAGELFERGYPSTLVAVCGEPVISGPDGDENPGYCRCVRAAQRWCASAGVRVVDR